MASENGRQRRWLKILYTLAMQGPLNPYKAWTRLVKEEMVTQPTIRSDLEQMTEKHLVKTVEIDHRAPGGRPSVYYELRGLGLASVIAHYDHLGDEVEDPHHFAVHVTNKYHDLLPIIFGLWPEFVREKVDHLAWSELRVACGLPANAGDEGGADDVYWMFFHNIIVDLTRPFESRVANHDAWLQTVLRNQTIRDTLLEFETGDLAQYVERVNDFLRLFPTGSSLPFESAPLGRLRKAVIDLIDFWPGRESHSTTAA